MGLGNHPIDQGDESLLAVMGSRPHSARALSAQHIYRSDAPYASKTVSAWDAAFRIRLGKLPHRVIVRAQSVVVGPWGQRLHPFSTSSSP